MTFHRVICSCQEENNQQVGLEAKEMRLLAVKMGTKNFLTWFIFFSRYLLNKNKSQCYFWPSREVAFHFSVFLHRVRLVKKGISKEMLAELSYCDTSSIYLVTSGRKGPYCAKKISVTIVCLDFKEHWKAGGPWSGVTGRALPWTDSCTCREFPCGTARSPSVQSTAQNPCGSRVCTRLFAFAFAICR